jgi:hypothetical protein
MKNTTTNYEMTKDQALDILVARVEKKFPGVDGARERAVLAKRSQASLMHSVGSQLWGDPDQADKGMCAYAYSQMTPAEQRVIDQAG